MFLSSFNLLVPSAVRNLSAVPISSSAINITWQPPADPNGNVHYRVEVLFSNDVITTNTSLVIRDLKVYTFYNITVIAENGAGRNSSDRITVRTLELSMFSCK